MSGGGGRRGLMMLMRGEGRGGGIVKGWLARGVEVGSKREGEKVGGGEWKGERSKRIGVRRERGRDREEGE